MKDGMSPYDSSYIADDAINASEIAADAVDTAELVDAAVTFNKCDRPYQSGRIVMTTDSASAGEDSTVTLTSLGLAGTDSIHCFAQVGINRPPDSVFVNSYVSDSAQITITASSDGESDDTCGINWFAVKTG